MKKTLYYILSCVILLVFSYIGNSTITSPEKPNIILFVVDDLGTNDAGCYNNPIIKIPSFDKLAKESVKFNPKSSIEDSIDNSGFI